MQVKRSRTVTRSRRWMLRVAAAAVGLLPLLLLEGGLRLAGLPVARPAVDPYVDLHNLQPLFQPAAEPGRLEIGSQRMHLFRPASFAATKPSGTYRVFALGGSTTQGEPYSTETAFPKWLQLHLQAASAEQTVEVINCGGLSYASYRVLAILREVLAYQPDLIVVYTGQNEYLEQRSYEGWQRENWRAWSSSRLANLRSVQLVRSLVGNEARRPPPAAAERTVMKAEVDALLDYQGGLEAYQRGQVWRVPVTEHFRWNLEQMVVACQQAKVPVVLVGPVVNLVDCPPFKMELAPELTPAERDAFEGLWERGKSAEDRETAVQCLEQARDIDPQHAGVNFLLGQLHYALGDYHLAKQRLVDAKDFDVCPLRATTAIQRQVAEVAQVWDVPYLDADELFSQLSPEGIVGELWLVDHIHPTIEGHQRLGAALADTVLQAGLFRATQPDWKSQLPSLYRQYLSSLGEEYFHRGKQRLEGLQLWTQGRAKKLRMDAEASAAGSPSEP